MLPWARDRSPSCGYEPFVCESTRCSTISFGMLTSGGIMSWASLIISAPAHACRSLLWYSPSSVRKRWFQLRRKLMGSSSRWPPWRWRLTVEKPPLGAAKRHDGGQLLKSGCLECHGHGSPVASACAAALINRLQVPPPKQGEEALTASLATMVCNFSRMQNMSTCNRE